MLKKIIAATTAPVTLERAKERLNVFHNDWDADIDALLREAFEVVEHGAGMALQPSTWEKRFNYWDWWDCWSLDLYPVRTVESVKYLDANGSEVTVDPSIWYFDKTPHGADLYFTSGFSAPTLYNRPGSVRVRFTAGFSDPITDVGSDSELTLPVRVEAAILLFVGHRNDIREAASKDQLYTIPLGFDYILSQLKVYR